MNDETRDALRDLLGPKGAITDTAGMASYMVELEGLGESRCDMVARPASTEEVARIVELCDRTKLPIVPLGGGTGLVGGGIADGGVVLSLERMNRVEKIDAANHTMTVQAGCVLANLHEAAAGEGCLFPLSLGSEGSCRIGGNLSTNAGGVGVLRYGNTRDLVLGLEVVLPDGRVWDGLNALRKDNTGYDLKQMFIGAEGTLGIITRAVLKLFPAPRTKVTAMAATREIHQVQDLFERTRAVCDERLTAFEMLPRIGVETCVTHYEDLNNPFAEYYPFYALVELTAPSIDDALRPCLERILGAALEDGIIEDAVFAESAAQETTLWALRERTPEAQTFHGASIKHDVAVPVSKTADFVAEAMRRIEAAFPGARVFPFGHMGDGNIHCNVTQPDGMEGGEFYARRAELNRVIHDLVAEMNGSISAEHGIGLLRREELEYYASPIKLELMRRIKTLFYPHNIMNPGKVVKL